MSNSDVKDSYQECMNEFDRKWARRNQILAKKHRRVCKGGDCKGCFEIEVRDLVAKMSNEELI